MSFFFLFICILCLTLGSQDGVDNSLPNEVLKSLNKLLDFVESYYEDFNVDGLSGLRICQGMIQQGIENVVKLNIRLAPHLRQKIDDTLWRMNRIIDTTYQYLEENGSKYDKSFTEVADRPMSRVTEYQHINTKLPKVSFSYLERNMYPFPENGTIGQHIYSEKAGDVCYKMVFRTAKASSKLGRQKCNVTKRCVDIFFSEETLRTASGYGPTHSVLYYYVTKVHGCENQVQSYLNRPLTSAVKELCTTSYAEAKQLVKHKRYMDLFMETITICGGMIGFEEFYRKDWWELVRSLQSDHGCYKAWANMRKKRSPDAQGTTWHSRKLLSDSYMRDGCWSHITGMGGAVMGTYLAYLMEHDGHLYKM